MIHVEIDAILSFEGIKAHAFTQITHKTLRVSERALLPVKVWH